MASDRKFRSVKVEYREPSVSSDHADNVKPGLFTSLESDKKLLIKPDMDGLVEPSLLISEQFLKEESKDSIDAKPDVEQKTKIEELTSDPIQSDENKVKSEGKPDIKVKEVKEDGIGNMEESNYEQTFDRTAPEGYTFVIAGSPYVTRHCKEITIAEDLKVWEVLEWQRKTVRGVAIGPQRIGLHVPTRIYDLVRMMSADRNRKIVERTARSREVLQSKARAMITELYPRLPTDKIESVREFVYNGFVPKSTGGFHKMLPGSMWNMVDGRVKHYVRSSNITLPGQTPQSLILEWQPPEGPLSNPHPPSESAPADLPSFNSPSSAPSSTHRHRRSTIPARKPTKKKKKKKKKKTKTKTKAKQPTLRPLAILKREFAVTLPTRKTKEATAASASKPSSMMKRGSRTKEESKPDVQLKLESDIKPPLGRDVKVESKVKIKEEATSACLVKSSSESPRKKSRLIVAEKYHPRISIKTEPNEGTADTKPTHPFSPSGSGKERRTSARLSGRRSSIHIKEESGVV